jgi:hypothetical protein
MQQYSIAFKYSLISGIFTTYLGLFRHFGRTFYEGFIVILVLYPSYDFLVWLLFLGARVYPSCSGASGELYFAVC